MTTEAHLRAGTRLATPFSRPPAAFHIRRHQVSVIIPFLSRHTCHYQKLRIRMGVVFYLLSQPSPRHSMENEWRDENIRIQR